MVTSIFCRALLFNLLARQRDDEHPLGGENQGAHYIEKDSFISGYSKRTMA